MISDDSASMAEYATSWIEKATNIKTTIVGYPSCGAWKCCGEYKTSYFDNFNIEYSLCGVFWEYYWDMYNIPYPIEGIGVTPDIYAETSFESLEVIKHLINDNELSLPY